MKKWTITLLITVLMLCLSTAAFADVQDLGTGLTESDAQALTDAIHTIEQTWMNRERSVQVSFTLSDKKCLNNPDELGLVLYEMAGLPSRTAGRWPFPPVPITPGKGPHSSVPV